MKFRYARYGQIFRPVIPVKLKHGEEFMNYEALVDSGADLCLFDADVLGPLKINQEGLKQQEIFGVGGKASLYKKHPVSIVVGGWEFEIEAGFMPNVAGRIMPYGILGQIGFFEHFTVKFDYSKKEIELNKKR